MKRYYTERNSSTDNKIDLSGLQDCFLSCYQEYEAKYYFLELLGDYCEFACDFKTKKKFGDVEQAIFRKTGLKDVWPFREWIGTYSKEDIFTLIEFLYDNVSKPMLYECSDYRCTYHSRSFNNLEGQNEFRKDINAFLRKFETGYRLSEEGYVLLIAPLELEVLVNNEISTDKEKEVDERIKDATNKYLKFDSTISDKKDAVRTLGDVLEYLREHKIILEGQDNKDLFNILNNFDLRHHNKIQHFEYDKEVWYEYFFYTFLSSINFLLKQNDYIIDEK